MSERTGAAGKGAKRLLFHEIHDRDAGGLVDVVDFGGDSSG